MKKLSRRDFVKKTGIFLGSTALGGFPSIVKASNKPVRIGVIFPFSGAAAKTGDDMWRGLIIAVEEINNAGGIRSLDGSKIELIKADHEGKPERE